MSIKIKKNALISSMQKNVTEFFCSPTPLYLGALIFIILEIYFFKQIPPNDYWWYLKAGEGILETYSIPAVDTFTYTQTGKPYPFIAWLSSVLFWLIRDSTAIILLWTTLVLTFNVIIWQCCRTVGAGTRLTFILTLLVVMVGSLNWAMRPQLFSFPLFAFSFLCILHWQRGNAKWVWCFPVIILLWVNLHGAFPLLFLLAGAALVGGGGNRKTLALALIATFFASLLNPQGIMVWNYVLSMLSHTTMNLGPEWSSPTTALSWRFKLFFILLLVFPIVTSLSSRRLTLTEWLWFLGFAWMALSGQRYVTWFIAVFAPINAILLTPLANRTIDRGTSFGTPGINAIIFTLLLLLPLSFLPKVREYWLPSASPVYTSNTPIAAVKWLKLHPELSGNLWADIAMASYIIYALPERPVWADTRTDLYPQKQWDDYISIINVRYNWEALLARDKVKLLLLDPNRQPLFIQTLIGSPHWHSPYQDENSIVFTLIEK